MALGFELIPSAANFVFAHHPQRDAAELAQDAFKDALLMECDEAQIRAVFRELIEELVNPYEPPDIT